MARKLNLADRERRFAIEVLDILRQEGPDIHERMGRIVGIAQAEGLGVENKDASEDTDPWLVDEPAKVTP